MHRSDDRDVHCLHPKCLQSDSFFFSSFFPPVLWFNRRGFVAVAKSRADEAQKCPLHTKNVAVFKKKKPSVRSHDDNKTFTMLNPELKNPTYRCTGRHSYITTYNSQSAWNMQMSSMQQSSCVIFCVPLILHINLSKFNLKKAKTNV